MEFKGTQGKWLEIKGNIWSDTDELVGSINEVAKTPEVIKSNAQIIAAAPEVLEALQALLKDVDNLDTHQNRGLISSQFEAREAIKKALD